MQISKTFSNPRTVNKSGGILIKQSSGRDLYIDKSHPQYAEVKNGLIGEVKEELIKEDAPTVESFTIEDAKEILSEIVKAKCIKLKDTKAKEKLNA